MSGEDDIARRVRFFGVHDLAAGWYVSRVAEIVEQFDAANPPSDAMDIIELHNPGPAGWASCGLASASLLGWTREPRQATQDLLVYH